MTKTVPYRESLMRALGDPVEASAYLHAALEDSQRAFLKALKNVAQARQMSRTSRNTAFPKVTPAFQLPGLFR